MRRRVAALRATVDLLIGVKVLRVLLQLHGVESDKGAKVTAKPLASRVAAPQVPEEDGLVGGGEVTLRAVIGLVCPIVSLHVGLVWEQSPAGVVATFAGRGAVHLRGMSHKLLSHGRPERAAVLEARQRLSTLRTVVRLHVSLEGPGEAEALPAGGAPVAVPAQRALFSVHVDEVAADCVSLHGGVLAQVAAVDHLTGLTQPVQAELALACEVTLAGGTLQAGVRRVRVEVLLQVGAHLEAASTFGTSVGAEDVLGSLYKVDYGHGHQDLK